MDRFLIRKKKDSNGNDAKEVIIQTTEVIQAKADIKDMNGNDDSEEAIIQATGVIEVKTDIEDSNKSMSSDNDDDIDRQINVGTEQATKKRKSYKQRFKDSWIKKFEWLTHSENNEACCKICNKTIHGGITHLQRHETSIGHQKRFKTLKQTPKIQKLIDNKEERQFNETVKASELKCIMFIAEHNLPFRLLDHLPQFLRNVCPDSKVATKIKCGRKKGTQLCSKCVTPEQISILRNDLNNCFYSLIIDETTDVSATKSLVVVARYAKDFKISDKFLGLIEVNSGTAESLFGGVINLLQSCSINLENMISFAADNATVMQGSKSGVQARFKEVLPHIFVMGCVCHSFHLCASAACTKLPPDIEEFCRDICLYFAHSSKKIIKLREFQVDAVTGKSISYREILVKSCSLAESLLRNGYRRNTVITVSSENNLQFFIPIISALYIGAITAPINHNYTEEEAIHTLNICKPKVIFCSKAVCHKYVYLKKTKQKYIEKIIIIDSDDQVHGAETMDEFIEKSLRGVQLYRFSLAQFDPSEQIALVMCSSGTTGLPKGVMQSHSNLMVRYMHTIDPRFTKRSETFLGILPFFHGYGLTTNFFALVQGQKIVVIQRFQEELFLKTIQDYRISALWLAPPLVVLLAKSPLVDKYDLSSIKEITCGAAPLSKNTEERVKKRLNIKMVRQGYGLTEATLAVFMLSLDDHRSGSSGKVVPYMICKVRDPETGKSLGPHQIGELCFKGPMLMKGYYGNEEATRNSFTSDGWLLSGDLGYYDDDEYFYVVDRLKELIKYKGFQVAPAELEAIILSNPKIKDVGVVGVPDEEAGELPLAFVVKNPNANITEKEIIDFVAGKVSSQKRLRGGVIFVSSIPKNPSGKILRRDLRKMLTKYKSKL